MTEQAGASEVGDLELQPGQLFAGRYEIERFLGEGDRKRTYLALDRKLEGLVALSLIKTEAAAIDPEGTAREARILRRIGSNPNIVVIHDWDTDPATKLEFLVFQYLAGGTLSGYVRERGPLPQDELLKFGRQLARGLSHLHKKGLVHRDVSPDNVWLDERHEAHLGDFDSVIAVDDPGDLLPLTTTAFASPEELARGKLDARSDLFSLGGVLHVLATGEERPSDVAELRSRRPDLPSSFADLVASLRTEDPSGRPESADAVMKWLDGVRHASTVDDLIAGGENDLVEFKASLCTPLKQVPPEVASDKGVRDRWWQGQVNTVRKEAAIAVAAFLNSRGGTLLIGVGDSGEVLGIEPDIGGLPEGQRNWDRWARTLRDVVVAALDEDAWATIRVSAVSRDGRTIAVASCPPRSVETWLTDHGSEEFYVRANNTSQLYSPAAAARYIRDRWPRP